MPSGSNRIDRMNEEIMRTLADALRNVKDPRIAGKMISVVRCEVSGDGRWCKVYLSVLGDYDKKELVKGLKSAAGYLRSELARRVNPRYTPELVFILDHSIAYGAHISEVLSNLNIPPEEAPDDRS